MKMAFRMLGILVSITILAFSSKIAPVGADSLAPPSIVITVDIIADEFLTTGGTGCSLREAVYSANYADYGGCARAGSTGRLTVRVPAGYYTLTRHGAGENFVQTGDLDILTSMDILGDGIGITIIDGDDADRVFDVLAFDLATVSISDVSIYDGYSGSGAGGAIKNTSNLYLTRVRLDGNHTDTSGGAIYHKSTADPASPPARPGAVSDAIQAPAAAAILTLEDSWIMSNTADGYGGGIINDVSSGMVIDHTTISFNQAYACGGMYNLSEMDVTLDFVHITNNYGEIYGGGFCSANLTNENVVIRDSHFAVNSTPLYGGNIVHDGNGTMYLIRSEVTLGTAAAGAGIFSYANTILENVTVSQNTASDHGGGILVGKDTLSTLHATIVDNIAPMGAGIYSSADVLLKSTIIARNTTDTGNMANCVGGGSGNITSQGHNLTDGGACAAPMVTDLVHTDPRLGGYGSNGSLNGTNTYALQLGSPAIDAADPGFYPAVDQRGIGRPQPVGGVSDIGAYESNVDRWFLPFIRR
jgi:CSLREA domain-containing protein